MKSAQKFSNKGSLPRFKFCDIDSITTSARFIKLSVTGGKDFKFVESAACNEVFDRLRNDGKRNVYFPVQDMNGKVSILSIDVAINTTTPPSAELVLKVVLEDGKEELTVFGSKISDEGILWLAVFSENCIIGYDLISRRRVKQYNGIACPNDVCFSDVNPNYLYVAGGTIFKDPFNIFLKKSEVSVPPVGRVYRIDVTTDDIVIIALSEGMTALSGINAIDSRIFVTQLYDMKSLDERATLMRQQVSASSMGTRGPGSTDVIQVWRGNEVVGENDSGYFLADNICVWDTHILCVAMYRWISNPAAAVVESETLSAAGWAGARFLTWAYDCCFRPGLMGCFRPNVASTLDNAETLLIFDNLDKFDDICFFLYNVKTKTPQHFRIRKHVLEIAAALAGENIFFDGHCTQVQRHGDKAVFVNFKSDHVLIVDVAEFRCI